MPSNFEWVHLLSGGLKDTGGIWKYADARSLCFFPEDYQFLIVNLAVKIAFSAGWLLRTPRIRQPAKEIKYFNWKFWIMTHVFRQGTSGECLCKQGK